MKLRKKDVFSLEDVQFAIIDKNLEIAGIDKKWLKSELKRKSINNKTLYIQLNQIKLLTK